MDDEAAVRRLTGSLVVCGLDERACWMTPGHATLAFLGSNRQLLAAVTLLGGAWIRWEGWSSDARLLNDEVAAEVLEPIGVSLGGAPG